MTGYVFNVDKVYEEDVNLKSSVWNSSMTFLLINQKNPYENGLYVTKKIGDWYDIHKLEVANELIINGDYAYFKNSNQVWAKMWR